MRSWFVAGMAVVWGVAVPALAQQEWDQRAVSALAVELAGAARSLKGTLADEPALAGELAPESDAARFVESVDVLGKVARRLSRALGDNKDRDTTRPLASHIRSSGGDAARYGERVMDAAWMQEHLVPVRDLAQKLSAYYFE